MKKVEVFYDNFLEVLVVKKEEVMGIEELLKIIVDVFKK